MAGASRHTRRYLSVWHSRLYRRMISGYVPSVAFSHMSNDVLCQLPSTKECTDMTCADAASGAPQRTPEPVAVVQAPATAPSFPSISGSSAGVHGPPAASCMGARGSVPGGPGGSPLDLLALQRGAHGSPLAHQRTPKTNRAPGAGLSPDIGREWHTTAAPGPEPLRPRSLPKFCCGCSVTS